MNFLSSKITKCFCGLAILFLLVWMIPLVHADNANMDNASSAVIGMTPDEQLAFREVFNHEEKSPPVKTPTLSPTGSLLQTSDQKSGNLVTQTKLVIRAKPISQDVYPLSASQSRYYVADTDMQVLEVIRGQKIPQTITIRDITRCDQEAQICQAADKQRVPKNSGESVFFLVPTQEPDVWDLADPDLGRGAIQNGVIQGVQKNLNEIRTGGVR